LKGQLVKIEFVFGVVIFALIIFFIGSQVNTNVSSVTSDSKYDELRAEAINNLNFIISDLSYDNEPYVLQDSKIDTANQKDAEGRCPYFENLGMIGYRIVINDPSGELLRCGGVSYSYYTITKNIFIENRNGTITYEVL